MIREIHRDDWQALREVRLRALAADPDAFLETHATASTLPDERWQERSTPDDAGSAFVVEREGSFDGMVGCFVADDPATVFLVGMWIAPHLRGTGVAAKLVECVIAWARNHAARRVCLSVEGDNARAARLYEKCGFMETEDPPPFPYKPNEGNRYYVLNL